MENNRGHITERRGTPMYILQGGQIISVTLIEWYDQ